MKEKIFNNLSLKIVSAVFAVILWTVIVNIYDPTPAILSVISQSSLLIHRVLLKRIIPLRLLMEVRYLLQ